MRCLVAGGVVYAAGLAAFALLAHWRYTGIGAVTLLPATVPIGVGGALVMVPLFGVILGAVAPGSAGAASGVLTTTQQSGLALGVGTLGTFFYGLMVAHGWAGATSLTLWAEVALALATAVGVAFLPEPRR